VSSESIVSPPSHPRDAEPCPHCGAPLAGDQRYCLECGERRAPMSSVLLGGPPQATSSRPERTTGPGLTPPGMPPPRRSPAGASPRGNAVTIIAGVGVLLLAMGVGVLIGRSSGGSKQAGASAPQVISVSTGPTTGAATGPSQAATFTDDWPPNTNGYTVRLQTLPRSSTQASAVEAAKAAATAKGAKAVGALQSDDFSSLKAGSYIVYSGVFHKRPEAQKALARLKKSFASASVIKVSGASASSTGSGSATGTSSGSGASGGALNHPAPPKAAEELSKSHGKSYEEKSKNLPNQVET